MAKEFHLPNPTTFGDTHSRSVLALPGRERFRTGISLRVPSKNPAELAKQGSSEDRIFLFVSFPYFGKSRGSFPLGPESESVRILDFKRLGVDVPDCSALVSREEGDDIGEVLVHQTRYMIFDNRKIYFFCRLFTQTSLLISKDTMATFRSKEDSAINQVPLHRFQERIGAFNSMIRMLANRMDSELWILGKLQASLWKFVGFFSPLVK